MSSAITVLDIGGTHVRWALWSPEQGLGEVRRLPSPSFSRYLQASVDELQAMMVRTMADAVPPGSVAGVSFGAALDHRTGTVYASGYALAGGGIAFAFPVVLHLAGEVGQHSDGTGGEREIGFVTTIAYTGFLIGPPAIGGLAHLRSLSFAIGVVGIVAMLAAPAALASAAARRREEDAPAVQGREAHAHAARGGGAAA